MSAKELKERIDLVQLIGETVPLKRGSSGEWTGRCPFHDDSKASLSVNGNKAVWQCLGCGKRGDGFSWIMELNKCDFRTAYSHLEQRYGNGASPASSTKPAETTWDIADWTGKVIATHIRINHPDGTKTFVWRRDGKDGLGGLKTADLPLYGMPEFFAAEPGADVILVEGEKARDSLKARGRLCLDTVTGANVCPSEATLVPLIGSRRVYLWPDADDAGYRHMDGIARTLKRLGVEVWEIHWPQAPHKGDAADFTGNLDALLAAARPWHHGAAKGCVAL